MNVEWFRLIALKVSLSDFAGIYRMTHNSHIEWWHCAVAAVGYIVKGWSVLWPLIKSLTKRSPIKDSGEMVRSIRKEFQGAVTTPFVQIHWKSKTESEGSKRQRK